MMSDADALLATRFAATFDHLDTSDWSDVLRRATPRKRRRRRVLLTGIAIALVVVPIGIAFRGPIHNLFFDSPAPPVIKRSFAGQNQMRVAIRKWAAEHHRGAVWLPPHVDPSKAHGVITVHTRDGLLFLWAAPTSGGRECWFVNWARDSIGRRRPPGGGSCDEQRPSANISFDLGWSALHPTFKVLTGRLYVTNAVAVLVDLGKKKPVRVPVVDRYFLAVFPRHVDLDARDVVAIDREGRVVAEAPR